MGGVASALKIVDSGVESLFQIPCLVFVYINLAITYSYSYITKSSMYISIEPLVESAVLMEKVDTTGSSN
jgi:hypothetical protein